jgi:5'-3' exonuclease
MPPKRGNITIDRRPNILLVDGNALYKTGYHGAKDEYNSKGEHIGGVYQFITMLRKLMLENLYHKVYVFWDGSRSGKLRYDIYPDYKISRGKDYIKGTKPLDDPDQIIERLKVQEYLEELYVRQLEHDIVESDDFIAYYCKERKETEKITIVSNDTDLCQLLDENVRIYLCNKKIYVTLSNYDDVFGHHQENSLLIKVISGDSSDDIKGVKGVKERTLLKHFPELRTQKLTLNEIIKKAELIQEGRAQEKKKPLKALDNIINGVTDGVQGERLYDINQCLVDLSVPLLTDDAKEEINNLMDSYLSDDDRGIKNAYTLMKRDEIDRLVKNYSIDYLLPFKKLIERERKTAK